MLRYLILIVALWSLPSMAQEILTLEAQVMFIAGQTVYVSAGSDAGLVAGDTLDVYRNESRLGLMEVVSATSDRAVLGFVDAPFPVTIGDHLMLSVVLAQPEPIAMPTPTPETERPSILDQGDDDAPRRVYSAPRVSGRLQIGMDGLMSSTQATDGGASFDRTYATPFALLRAKVENLPGGFELSTRLRAAYRYADPTPFSEEVDVRVYDLNLGKSFSNLPLEIRAGRFYNRYDRFTGYWDGLNIHVGDKERGFGVAAGFQPDRDNEMPTTDLPKYTVFGHAAFETEGVRFDGTVLGGQILPQSDSLSNRTFAGFQQQVFAGKFRASAEALADQDPETGEWVFSRLSARASVTAAPGLRLRGFAISRRSYILFGDWQALLSRSTRIGGGATVSLRNGPLPGVSVRADAANSFADGQPNTLTINTGISVPRLPSTSVGLSLNATMWQNESLGETRRGLYGGAGFSKSFGSTYARLGYRYQQSPLLGLDDLISHGINAMLQVPLRSGLAITLQASANFSDSISSTRLYSAIWYRF